MEHVHLDAENKGSSMFSTLINSSGLLSVSGSILKSDLLTKAVCDFASARTKATWRGVTCRAWSRSIEIREMALAHTLVRL